MYKKAMGTIKNGTSLMKCRVFTIVMLICVITLGCAPKVYRLYSNSSVPRMTSEIATLVGDINDEIVLLNVDGQYPSETRKFFGDNFIVELLPGRHTITVKWTNGLLTSEDVVLEFEAAASVTYAVMGPMDKRRPKNAGVITILPQNMWIDNKKN